MYSCTNGAHLARLAAGELLERRDVDLDVEVAGVADDGAVLHRREVLAAQDFQVAGERAEDVADRHGLGHRHHAVAVHLGLERLERIDLGDDDVGAEPARAHRDAAAAPAVAGDDERRAREQEVRRADDAVDRGLPGAVAVVEEVLGERVVHRDDREAEDAVLRHRLEADDAGGGLLGGADDLGEQRLPLVGGEPFDPLPDGRLEIIEAAERDHVDRADDIGAVIHRDVGLVRDRGADVLVVRLLVLALDREDLDAVVLHEMRGDIVLRRERVRGAERDVGAAGLERHHQVRRLGGDVEAGGDLPAGEGALLREARAHLAQHLHGALGPLGAAAPLLGEREVLDVVGGGGGDGGGSHDGGME